MKINSTVARCIALLVASSILGFSVASVSVDEPNLMATSWPKYAVAGEDTCAVGGSLVKCWACCVRKSSEYGQPTVDQCESACRG